MVKYVLLAIYFNKYYSLVIKAKSSEAARDRKNQTELE